MTLNNHAPLLEYTIMSRLFVVTWTRLLWTINRGGGQSRVSTSLAPNGLIEGVRVQKTPHLFLDVPQILPAKCHPGNVAEEAVQALESAWEGEKARSSR